MKTKSLAFTLICLLLSCFAVPVLACCPDPSPGPCYVCEDGVWVWPCGSGNCCNGSCCYTTCCNNVCCPAGQICCGTTTCCSPDRCCNGVCCGAGTCCSDSDCGHPNCWICIKCQCIFLCETDDCEDCILGSCTDRCPLLGQCKKCDGCGGCVTTCHPELCEECVNNECKVCGGDTSKCCINGECRTCLKREPLDPVESDHCSCDAGDCSGISTWIQLHTCVPSSCSSSGYTGCAWAGGQHIGYYWGDCTESPNYLGILECWLLNASICYIQCYAAAGACALSPGSWECSDALRSCYNCLIEDEGIDCGCLTVICIYPEGATKIYGSDQILYGPCGL